MLKNPYRTEENIHLCPPAPFPSINAEAPLKLLARCPEYSQTPLHTANFASSPHQFFIKDERQRMGLGSFKALGAAYVIAHMAQNQKQGTRLNGYVFATASAGNHGLSVAAAAQIFGAKSVIFLSKTVPQSFADRLSKLGADVRRAGDDYEASMEAAMQAADENEWILLSDSSWPDYYELPHRLMEGYLVLAAETAIQMDRPPTHIFLQAGVGGMAAACAAYFRSVWGNDVQIHVVEPDAAPALYASIEAGAFQPAANAPLASPSNMGRLDCKEASLIALNGLARDTDSFILISDDEVESVLSDLKDAGFETTPSGGAGIAAALLDKAEITDDARILCILSENS